MKIPHIAYAAIPVLLVSIASAIIWQTWKSGTARAKPEEGKAQARTKLVAGQEKDQASFMRQKRQQVKGEASGRNPQDKRDRNMMTPGEMAESEEAEDVAMNFKASTDNDEKIELLGSLGSVDSGKVLDLLYLALDDSDEDVRIAAANLFDGFEGEALIHCVAKAMDDSNAKVRTAAINALVNVDSPETANILLRGSGDKDEEVRDAVFNVLYNKDPEIKETIAREAISSKRQDVKSRVVDLLLEIPSYNVMAILIDGLKDNDPEFRNQVSSVISFFVTEEFKSYDDAKRWWTKNKDRFDEHLAEK
jgi:hypothetical protein